MLVHMAPQEVAGLQSLALAHGGSLTINPDTGLPEAGFLKKLLPMLAGAALNYFLPGVGTAIGSALGTSAAVGTGIAVGGFETLRTGDLSKGLMAGMGAYGGAGLSEGLMSAGASSGLDSALANAGTAEGAQGQAFNRFLTSDANPAIMSNADKLSAGFNAVTKDPSAFGNFAKQNAGSLLAATSPLLADQGVDTVTKLDNPGFIRNFDYDPMTQRAKALNPIRVRDLGYAEGGEIGAPKTVTQMPGANPYKDSQAAYEYLMGIAPKAPQQNTQPQASFNPASEGRYAWDYDKKAYTWIPANAVEKTTRNSDSTYNPYEYGGSYGGGDSGPGPGPSGGGFGSSMDSNAANSITGIAGPVNSSIAVSDMGTVSEAAAAAAAAAAAGMAESANASAVDDGSISDGVTSGPSNADSSSTSSDSSSTSSDSSSTSSDSSSSSSDGASGGDGAAGTGAGDGEANGGLMRLYKKFADGGAARVRDGSSEAAYNYLMGLTNSTRPDRMLPIDEFEPQIPVTPVTPATPPAPPIVFPTDPPPPPPFVGPKPPPENTVVTPAQKVVLGNPSDLRRAFAGVSNASEIGGGITTLPVITEEPSIRTKPIVSSIPDGGDKTTIPLITPSTPLTLPEIPKEKTGIVEIESLDPNITIPDEVGPKKGGGGDLPEEFDKYLQPDGGTTVTLPADTAAVQDDGTTDVILNEIANTPVVTQPTVTETAGGGAEVTFPETASITESPLVEVGNAAGDFGDSGFAADSSGFSDFAGSFGGGGGGGKGNMLDNLSVAEYAHGGMLNYAMGGGLGSLGGYSDGGRLLRGPGDGVSDSIPAMIGKKQPARLADGEFVVPARIVSELGNGSTEAGARKLYQMMDRIQAARSKTVGKGRVAKNSRADKYLPA
jgi:hypothetical protein